MYGCVYSVDCTIIVLDHADVLVRISLPCIHLLCLNPRIRIAIESEQININSSMTIDLSIAIKAQAGTIGILVRVQQNVCTIIFVVALVSQCSATQKILGRLLSCTSIWLQCEDIWPCALREIETTSF